MKSPFHWKNALLVAASMLPLAGDVSADSVFAIGSRSRTELVSQLASGPLDRLVKEGQHLGLTTDAPAGSARGSGATATSIYVQRTADLHNPTLSTFVITFAPGGSVVLHGAPSAGYVLVHVLSGAVTAGASQAQVGIYGAGETWAEPFPWISHAFVRTLCSVRRSK